MSTSKTITGILIVSLLWLLLPAGTAAETETQPADKPVPKKLLKEIRWQFRPLKKQYSPAETTRLLSQRMKKVLALGTKAEKNYPNASNLHEVRNMMLSAADFLSKVKPGKDSQKRLLDIARRVMASDAPSAKKVQADFFITRAKLSSAPKPAEQIRDFAKRYEKTDSTAMAVVYATMLAAQAKDDKLRNELLDHLEAKHAKDRNVQALLRYMGRGKKQDANAGKGKPFQADLMLLDGGKLTLPDDLIGKVLIIDFWATWCPPCRTSVPHLKKIYAKYKSSGLEIVGISLDKNRKTLADFVRNHKMDWIHCYSGKGWEDPTAQKYGVRGIPSVWVVGRDGKVVSDSARRNLEQIIAKALKVPADGKKR
ncbi:MAG: TlpA disulfide reductase family protein [Planctomycetota bacterium]|nr:TlpA disulfide reductase family protein [Planctomycetota bacterium]